MDGRRRCSEELLQVHFRWRFAKHDSVIVNESQVMTLLFCEIPVHNAHVFLPIRHLLLQGPVSDPKRLGPTLQYQNWVEFDAAFDTLLVQLSDDDGADSIASELRTAYLNPKYYYMFSDVEGYADYILSEEAGIAAGLDNHPIDSVQLRVNGSTILD